MMLVLFSIPVVVYCNLSMLYEPILQFFHRLTENNVLGPFGHTTPVMHSTIP